MQTSRIAHKGSLGRKSHRMIKMMNSAIERLDRATHVYVGNQNDRTLVYPRTSASLWSLNEIDVGPSMNVIIDEQRHTAHAC